MPIIISDTLSTVATSSEMQQIIVILQGLLLLAGAIINLVKRK